MTTDSRISYVLPEDELRIISRSVRSFVPSSPSTADSTIQDQLNARSGLIPSHRVAAWNTLCSLIEHSLESSVPSVSSLIWTGGIWDRAFQLYLSHAQSARPKSSRQLLVTLTKALQRNDDPNVVSIRHYATEKLIGCLIDYEGPHAAKVSAQLIGHLLSKDVLSISDVLLSLRHCQVGSTPGDVIRPFVGSHMQELLEVILQWLTRGDFGSTIAQLLSILLDKAEMFQTPSGYPIWIEPLENALRGDVIDINSLRVHILPVLFKRSFKDFVLCLRAMGLDVLEQRRLGETSLSSKNQESLLFAALQTGKELGLLHETDDAYISYAATVVLIPTRLIGRLLSHSSRSARLTGLSLLVTSHSATKPLSPNALKLIKRALEILFADVDADFRSDVFGAFQRLIDRIRGVCAMLARDPASPAGAFSGRRRAELVTEECPKQSLKLHQELLVWAVRFLTWELRPTASYQRHISALKCLSSIAKSGLDRSVSPHALAKSALGMTRWPFHVSVMSVRLHRLLIDLVLDPFDDVRQTASAILSLYASLNDANAEAASDDTLTDALKRAEFAMLNSGRADQADGIAHIYTLCSLSRQWNDSSSSPCKTIVIEDLMSKLQKMIQIAQIDLGEAVERYPVHGLLTSIRYVLSQDIMHAQQDIHCRIFEQLKQVWTVVKPVLCNDAPEGYMPEEREQSSDRTKETLSYCWRALKEASLLLGALVSGYQVSDSNTTLLLDMSDVCFTQLAELRHRGAFSTVAQTWTTCCIACRSLSSESGAPLLEVYFARTMALLQNNVTINTRRSAGLPALLCGILVADKTNNLLEQACKDLEQIARQPVESNAAEEGSLPQVHAINCLKDLLKNTGLGEQSKRYVPVALKLAADALQSEVWAIRNCGLMLFRAVIDRLLGTDQSYFEDDIIAQKRLSAREYPELVDVVLGLLSQGEMPAEGASVRYEGVFPALQLLSHTRLPDARFMEVINAVRRLTGCHIWHVRNKAAKTLAFLLVAKQDGSNIASALDILASPSSLGLNVLHGNLLVAKYTFAAAKRITEQRGDMQGHFIHDDWISLCRKFFHSNFSRFLTASTCFVIQATLVDCLRECFGVLAGLGKSPDETKAYCSLLSSCLRDSLGIEPDSTSSHTQVYQSLCSLCVANPVAAQFRQATARLLAQQTVYEESEDECDVSTFMQLVVELAMHDQDACKEYLTSLDIDKLKLSKSKRCYVFDLGTKILETEFDITLKCEAQAVLLNVLSVDLSNARSVATPCMVFPGQPLTLSDGNQPYADLSLQLRALRFDGMIAAGGPLEPEVIKDIAEWVDDCVAAVNGSGIYTREAAAFAMSRLHILWETMSSVVGLAESYRVVCIVLYDLLNDDDEDIRLIASNVVARILSANESRPMQTFEPIIASRKLLGYLVRSWTGSSRFMTVSIERAFGVSADLCVPVREQLELLSHQGTALFAEEKQNLYIDEAKEARTWSQVLQRTSPETVPRTLITKVAQWVSGGLDALLDQAQCKDGPLGWTSNAEVFTLGLQVVYGVEVLLYWVKQGIHLPVRPSYIRRQLFECSLAFREAEVNDLWLQEVDRILANTVMDKLLLVHQLLAVPHR